MTTGIQETSEVITLIKELSVVIEEAKSDGVLNIFDAVKLLKLSPSFFTAIKGSGDIKEELKDLTGEEKDMLIGDLRDAIFAFIGALT